MGATLAAGQRFADVINSSVKRSKEEKNKPG